MLCQEHLFTLDGMDKLSLVLSSQGKYDEAEPMPQHMLELKEKVLGQEHPSALNNMNNLALVLYKNPLWGKSSIKERLLPSPVFTPRSSLLGLTFSVFPPRSFPSLFLS